MTITEAFELYEQQELYNKSDKTKKNFRSAARSFTRAVGDIPVQIIGRPTLARWEWDMKRRGVSGTSMRTDIGKLRQILKFLNGYDLKVMRPEEVTMPKNDTKAKEWLLPSEVESMLKVCRNPRERALLAVLWTTGARISEILNLNREDLDKEYITICGKGGKYRDITLDVQTRVYIDQYLETRTDNYSPLFLSAQSRRITVSRVEQIIHEIAGIANIDKNVTPHTFRHSFITDMLTNDAPLKEVSELVGHAQTSTTLNIYHHIMPTRKWDAKAKYHTPLS